MTARGQSRRSRRGVLAERAHQVRDIQSQGISLRACCARIGLSYGYGRQLVADGKFPVPEIQRLSRRSWHRYSTVEIEHYLRTSSLAGVA